jgi:hypothetical protein
MGTLLTPTGATVVTAAATVIDVFNGSGYGFMVRNTSNAPLLQIAGNTGAATFSGAFLEIGGSGVSAPPAGLSYGLFPQSSIGLGLSSLYGMTFWTGTTPAERMKILSSGGVEIKNLATTSAGVLVNSPDGFTGGGYVHSSLRTAGQAWYHFIAQSGNGSTITTNNILIYGNGNVENTNNSYGAFSDIKLKENIVDATPKLNALLNVKIRNYNLIGDERKQIGVIAQELEQVFPGLVDEINDRDVEGNILETTTKSVKYSVFVPMLIKAIQEQQAQIEELKAKILSL